ncbi:hypothetical protein BC833DRAFT_520743 [Globomyces pollinis-pini]|nr:hypothetical protein BC833DRAFT_520743 [Globomyces pollinis-pini]
MIRQTFNRLKVMNFPWKSKKFRGYDLDGNMYFEEPSNFTTSKTKRTVEYSDQRSHPSQYNPNSIPVQWQAWMRHTRPGPPSIDELHLEIVRRTELQRKVAELEAKDAESKEKPKELPESPWKDTKQEFQPQAWTPPTKSQ